MLKDVTQKSGGPGVDLGTLHMGGSVLEEARKQRDHDWLKLCFCSTYDSYQQIGRTKVEHPKINHLSFFGYFGKEDGGGNIFLL
jgi:hypothetical protein